MRAPNLYKTKADGSSFEHIYTTDPRTMLCFFGNQRVELSKFLEKEAWSVSSFWNKSYGPAKMMPKRVSYGYRYEVSGSNPSKLQFGVGTFIFHLSLRL